MEPVKIGLLGLGTVGGGTVSVLSRNADEIARRAGREMSISHAAAKEYNKDIPGLDTIGKTDILSSPRITAKNREEAKILVGSSEPYVTSTTTTPSSGPTTTAESVNFIEVGVKLYVTPTIHEDNFITMKIKPEVSSVTSTLATSNNNTIPVTIFNVF